MVLIVMTGLKFLVPAGGRCQKLPSKVVGLPSYYCIYPKYLGPVVQSVISLTSSLRVISLTVLADSTYNILIFFAEATHIFSAKNFSIFPYHSM